jgi:hypothetical protein
MTLTPNERDEAVALAALSYWGSGDHKSFLASYESMPLESPVPWSEMNAILREAERLSVNLTRILTSHVHNRRLATQGSPYEQPNT